jgi:hypothetical protein
VALLTAEATVSLEALGIVGPIDDEAALRRAQQRNARHLQDQMREKAREYVGTRSLQAGGGTRNRGQYPGPMSDYYFADVQGTDADVIGWNPTARADYFEFGTEPHEIWASGLFERGQARPARGLRGQFTRGAEALAFYWDTLDESGFFLGVMVNHPGQEAMPVMEWALEDSLDTFERNIADELEREIGGAGAGEAVG